MARYLLPRRIIVVMVTRRAWLNITDIMPASSANKQRLLWYDGTVSWRHRAP